VGTLTLFTTTSAFGDAFFAVAKPEPAPAEVIAQTPPANINFFSARYIARRNLIEVVVEFLPLDLDYMILDKSLDNQNWDSIRSYFHTFPQNQVRTNIFQDNLPRIGDQYYRIRLYNTSQEVWYTQTIRVNLSASGQLTVTTLSGTGTVQAAPPSNTPITITGFPNPAITTMTVTVQDAIGVAGASLQILDFAGVVQTNVTVVPTTSNAFLVDVSGLISGIYTARVLRNGSIGTLSFIKL
jgi:hypothetical protein